MMSPSDMEGGVANGGGGGGKFAAPWWLDAWKSQIVTGLALFELLTGVITLISIFPTCIIAGVLQVLSAVVVLAVEAPMFVSFLSFAAPIGAIFESKPVWMKAAAYVVLAVLPCLPGCFGLFYILGFVAGLAIGAIYGMAFLGPKASQDQMRVAAGGGGDDMMGGGYSPQ